jgi:hypothetical protein
MTGQEKSYLLIPIISINLVLRSMKVSSCTYQNYNTDYYNKKLLAIKFLSQLYISR